MIYMVSALHIQYYILAVITGTDVNPFPNNTYYSMNVLNNYAAFVGWQGDKAVITLIKRNL
ncbi:MAG: hypothetical protein M5T52_22835 [Ignavibacteriaceae bacterium]|nr:hypothetical protein [Ignavibacteriaceae bacterium]